MGIEQFLLKALQLANYANGVFVIVPCALAGILLAPRLRQTPAPLPLGLLARAALCLLSGLALAYAFYPNFSDHAEPAMATLGLVLLKGKPLYPALDAYSFHGLLYGPLLAESQAAALFLGSSLAGLPVLLSSKLAGVFSFLAATGVFFTTARTWGFSRAYYALFLLPFGLLAFWNRCEPLFLLLVAISFRAVEFRPPWRALLVLGICAGLASGLKLHGFLYIVPALVAYLAKEKVGAQGALILAASAAGAFLLLFLPGNVSLRAFADYLLSATAHGLSWRLLLVNLIFVAALWSPLLVVARPAEWARAPLLALAALQLLVAVVGSKPGAGIHHLLPFIPANALLFAPYAANGRKPGANWVWVAMLIPGLATSALLAWTMARDWRPYAQASQELERIQSAYPDLVMGLAGNNTYPYVFLRPMLEKKGETQVEYSSYMDLQLVGVSDAPLRLAFESCRVRHLAMPKGEPPYAFRTYYDPMPPLFSDALRETFARRFRKVASGRWYDAYECEPRKD